MIWPRRCRTGSYGLIFLPYMAGERSPIWNAECERCISMDLVLSKTKGHMVRAALEGVAYSLEHNLRYCREQTGVESWRTSRNGWFCKQYSYGLRSKADVTGKVIKVPCIRYCHNAWCSYTCRSWYRYV